MNTTQLECFIAVAHHLNFSKAADELKLTQPAVSHQIRTLEEELEVKLFKRTSKKVALTPEGIQFLPDAEKIIKTAFAAKKRLGNHENLIHFDLGYQNYMELCLLPEIFRKLTSEFPLLRPSARLIALHSLLGLVENQNLHAAFSIKDDQKKSALSFKELCSAPIACVCSPEHPLAQYETLTKTQLSGSFIACTPRQLPSPVFSIQSRIISGISPEQQYFAEDIASSFLLAKALLGYTLYPDVPQLRDPELVYIPVTDLPRLAFGVYYRYDNDHPVLKRFLALCSELTR